MYTFSSIPSYYLQYRKSSRTSSLATSGVVRSCRTGGKPDELRHEPEHLTLLQQLRGSSTTVYMTLLSILQGVALSDLASVVEANYTHFTLVHWLLVLSMLGLIVSVWHQILIDSISFDWVPDLGDAILPFGIGVLELLLNHLIPLSLGLWLFLLAAALCSLEVVGGALFVRRKAEQAIENTKLLSLLRRRQRPYLLHGISGVAVFLLLGLFSIVEGLSATDGLPGIRGLLATCIAALAVVWVTSLLFTSKGYWQAVVDYARTGRISDS